MVFFSGILSSCGWFHAAKVTRNKSGTSLIMMRTASLLCMVMMMNFILIMRMLMKNSRNNITDLTLSCNHACNIYFIKIIIWLVYTNLE